MFQTESLKGVTVAVCEAGPLTPEFDAGSRAVSDLIEGLRSLGAEVCLFSEVDGDLPASIVAFQPDVIVVSRPGLFIRLYPFIREVGAQVVYMGHDLHFVRIGLGEKILGHGVGLSPKVMKMVEDYCFRRADLSVLPSEVEATLANQRFLGSNAKAMTYFSMKPQPIAQSGDGLRLVFVGGSNHHPNRDGLLWFLKYVWPELKRRLPTSELTVCGHWENGILPSESENVEFTGQIPEAALLDILSNSTIGISPLRFGAGMKRKTLSYFSSGLPVVSTKYGVEGLASSPEIVPGTILAETPEEWVSAIYDLSSDNQLWKQKSAEGLMFVETRFSPNAFLSSIGSLFSELLERKVSDGRTQSSI